MLVLTVITLFAFSLPTFTSKIFSNPDGDLDRFQLPMKQFYSNSLKSGESVLWNPHISSGYDVYGEGAGGFSHPLHYILYRFLPFVLAFNLNTLLFQLFLFSGMVLLLRQWKFSLAVSLFGGLSFLLTSYCFVAVYVANATLGVVSHIPWILIYIDKLASEPRKIRFLLILSLLTGSQLLLGFPQFVMFSCFLEISWLLMSTAHSKRFKYVCYWSISKFLACLISAVQLVSTWQAATLSSRNKPSLDFLLNDSINPINLLQFLSPYVFEGRAYKADVPSACLTNGMMLFLLMCWVVWNRKNITHHKKLLNWSVYTGFISFVLSLGKYGGLYYLTTYIPFVNMFRAPARYILIFHFCMVLIACISLINFLNNSRNKNSQEHNNFPLKKLYVIVGGGSLCLLFMAIWLQSNSRLGHNFSSTNYLILSTALVFISLILLTLFIKKFPHVLCAIVFFSLCEQFFYGVSYLPKLKKIETLISEFPKAPLAPDKGRIKVLSRSLRNGIVLQGYKMSDGYHAIGPKKILDYDKEASIRAAGVCQFEVPPESFAEGTVKDYSKICYFEKESNGFVVVTRYNKGWITARTFSKNKEHLFIDEKYHKAWRLWVDNKEQTILNAVDGAMKCVLEPGRHSVVLKYTPQFHLVDGTMPYAWFVEEVLSSTNPRDDILKINLSKTCLVEKGLSKQLKKTNSEIVKITKQGAGKVEMKSELLSEKFLVLSESYHPSWKVQVNGVEEKIYQTNGDFMGCYVDKGLNHIVWTYSPNYFKWWKITSLSTFFVIVLTLLFQKKLILIRKLQVFRSKF